jgi:hypothetical protein
MLGSAPSPARSEPSRRLLGQEPAVLVFATIALMVTALVLFVQTRVRDTMQTRADMDIFYQLFAFGDYPASFLMIGALFLAAVPPLQRVAARLAQAIGERPALFASGSGLVFAAGAIWAYHAHPLSMDEAAPYMQAKTFAEGSLVGKFPVQLIDWLIHPNFENYFIHVSRKSGEIASSYWPGFALLLTPFMAAGVPWLCNPVLGALSVWVIHRLTLRLTDSVTAAGAAALFALASAAFVVDAMSFYSMTAHLLLNAIFALLLIAPTPGRCALAGLAGGLSLTLHNPVPHMLFATPWLAWLVFQKNRWSLLAAIGASYLPWIVVIGFGWSSLLQGLAHAAAGSAQTEAEASTQIARAFARLLQVFHLPGADELWSRLVALGKLWLWAAPFLALLAGVGFWAHRKDVRFQLLLASAALTFVAFLFVPLTQGHGWGFRYFHSAWFVLPVFAAAALARPMSKPAHAAAQGRVALGGAVAGLLIVTPYFVWHVHSFIGNQLAQTPQTNRGETRVVLYDLSRGYYKEDLVQNDPFLRGPIIRMISHGLEEDARMMAREFPGLVMLEKNFRGSAWGYASPPPAGGGDP